jgi:hypothetical protein
MAGVVDLSQDRLFGSVSDRQQRGLMHTFREFSRSAYNSRRKALTKTI